MFVIKTNRCIFRWYLYPTDLVINKSKRLLNSKWMC